MALFLPVEIIHATESSNRVANNIYHCWLFHSKISEIQIILMFQQNIFLVTFFELFFHMIYQIFFTTFSGSIFAGRWWFRNFRRYRVRNLRIAKFCKPVPYSIVEICCTGSFIKTWRLIIQNKIISFWQTWNYIFHRCWSFSVFISKSYNFPPIGARYTYFQPIRERFKGIHIFRFFLLNEPISADWLQFNCCFDCSLSKWTWPSGTKCIKLKQSNQSCSEINMNKHVAIITQLKNFNS